MANTRNGDNRAPAARQRPGQAARPFARPAAKRLMLAAGIGAVLVLAACSPRVDIRGNAAEKEDMIHIRQGITKAPDVRRVLGPPSTVSAFDNKIWYYISKREETKAFFKPTVVTQQVIELQFDEAQVVQRIQTYGLKDARKVERVSRTTQVVGGEPGVFRSMIDLIVRRRAVTGKSRKRYGL